MADDKTFRDYFTESMRAAGIPDAAIPTAGFDTTAGAMAAISTIAEAAKMVGARATLGELIAVCTAGGGGLGAGGAGLVAMGAVKATAGILAAYWLGCVIGATIYAIQMLTIGDSWLMKFASNDVDRLFNLARANGIELPYGIRSGFRTEVALREKSGATAAA